MPSDKFKLEGVLRIQLKNRKTGKIEYDSGEIKNALTLYGAMRLMNCYDGVGAVSGTVTRLNLYYTGGDSEDPVKSLTGSYGSRTATGTYLSNTLTVQDTSTDTYTFRYMGIHTSSVTGWLNNLNKYDYGSNVTKGADQTLTVTWEIRISYS